MDDCHIQAKVTPHETNYPLDMWTVIKCQHQKKHLEQVTTTYRAQLSPHNILGKI